MADQSTEERAKSLLVELQQQQLSRSPWWLALILALALLLVMALSLLDVDKRAGDTASGFPPPSRARSLLVLPAASATPASFLVVQPDVDGLDDIFTCGVVPTRTCTNLTSSPAVAEAWPVLDGTGQQIAYYALSDAGTELFLRSLAAGTSIPLTVSAGKSGLHTAYEITPTIAPAFSPKGGWIAFPAQAEKGDAVELFAAQTDGQDVRRVTNLGHGVRDYVWIDDWTLVVAVVRPDGTLQLWKARLDLIPAQMEPLP